MRVKDVKKGLLCVQYETFSGILAPTGHPQNEIDPRFTLCVKKIKFKGGLEIDLEVIGSPNKKFDGKTFSLAGEEAAKFISTMEPVPE